MEQKKFMDIERAKLSGLALGNTKAFEIGDMISIQEKVDGSNGMICYDEETNKILAFSRRKPLDEHNTLNGFWNYSQTLDMYAFKKYPTFRVFGEWCGAKNHIDYNGKLNKRWIVYDIYDTAQENWLPQYLVETFCNFANLEYIHVLYQGEFKGWDWITKEYTEQVSHYANVKAEGIVIKNQTKLNNPDNRSPFVLKIVNESYSEVAKQKVHKVDSAENLKEKEIAIDIVNTIVTKRRVEKAIEKLKEDSEIPNELTIKEMGTLAKIVPKMIYDDCVKEEPEYVKQAGQYFSKYSNQTVMKLCKEIVCGI